MEHAGGTYQQAPGIPQIVTMVEIDCKKWEDDESLDRQRSTWDFEHVAATLASCAMMNKCLEQDHATSTDVMAQ